MFFIRVRTFFLGILFILSSLFLWGQSNQKISYDYERMLEIKRKFLTGERGDRVQKYLLKKVFKEELEISEELQREFGFESKLKEMSVQQFLMLLQHNPDRWDQIEHLFDQFPNLIEKGDNSHTRSLETYKELHELIEKSGIRERFSEINNPTAPFILEVPEGELGYSNLKFYSTQRQRLYLDGTKAPADNMIEVLNDFLLSPEVKEVSGNSYDSDLRELSDALIQLKKKSVFVEWGIDNDVVKHKKEAQDFVEKLRKAGYVIVDQEAESKLSFEEQESLKQQRSNAKNLIYLVDATGLNHEKIIAVNWSDPATAKIWSASGNFTASGMHPLGDLAYSSVKVKEALPNANGFFTMDSYLASLVFRDHMIMLFEMGMRGTQLPLSGSFRIPGRELKNGKRSHYNIAFGPGGGLRDITENIMGYEIQKAPVNWPIGKLTFVNASPELTNLSFNHHLKQKQAGISPIHWTVGDPGFTLRDYSQSLVESGMKVLIEEDSKRYVLDLDSPWVKEFGEAAMGARNFVGANYFQSYKSIENQEGQLEEYSVKMHNKSMVLGGAIVSSEKPKNTKKYFLAKDGLYYQNSIEGISFVGNSNNLGRTTRSNNEQVSYFYDPLAHAEVWASIMGLAHEEVKTIRQQAEERNNRATKLKDLNIRGLPLDRKVQIEKYQKKIQRENIDKSPTTSCGSSAK